MLATALRRSTLAGSLFSGGRVLQPSTSKMATSSNKQHLFESDAQKELELASLLEAGWTRTERREAIFRSFQFRDFNEAFSFMTAVALQAEKMDHHPEWFNVYNRVDITLASHFCNGISKLDLSCARYIDTLYASRYSATTQTTK